MEETPWQVAGRFVKMRRERLGLKQEDLRLYGGPKVSTVGKFERAAQESFPLRTQHAIENALGWSRGTIENLLDAAEDPAWKTMWEGDYYERLVVDDPPDLSRPEEPEVRADRIPRAADLSDEELLAELGTRLLNYGSAVRAYRNAAVHGLNQPDLVVVIDGKRYPVEAKSVTLPDGQNVDLHNPAELDAWLEDRRFPTGLQEAARTTGQPSRGQKLRAEADQAGEPPADDPDDVEPR